MRLFPSAGGARWAPRLLSVLLFALLCAVIAYWALRLFEPPVRIAPSGSLAATGNVASLGPAHNLFGRTGACTGPVVEAISSSDLTQRQRVRAFFTSSVFGDKDNAQPTGLRENKSMTTAR